MRKNVLASLLVLCGSTAAIAQMTPQQTPPTTQEAPGSAVDEALNNQTTTTEPTDPTTNPEPTTPDMNTPLESQTPDSTSAPDSRTNTPPSEIPEPQG